MEVVAQPGFRFYPTEEELVSFYLHKKLEGTRPDLHRVIPVVPVYDIEPWNLPSTDLFHKLLNIVFSSYFGVLIDLFGFLTQLGKAKDGFFFFFFLVLCVAALAGELCQGETEQWFFFMPRQEREARGGRPCRTTASGYWKATGSPGYVYSSDNRVIGVKKTMVFYKGKAPTGRKTKWKMNEYRAIEVETGPSNTAVPKVYVQNNGFLLHFSH